MSIEPMIALLLLQIAYPTAAVHRGVQVVAVASVVEKIVVIVTRSSAAVCYKLEQVSD